MSPMMDIPHTEGNEVIFDRFIDRTKIKISICNERPIDHAHVEMIDFQTTCKFIIPVDDGWTKFNIIKFATTHLSSWRIQLAMEQLADARMVDNHVQ